MHIAFSTSGPPAIKLHGRGFLGCIFQRIIILFLCQQTGLSSINAGEKGIFFNLDLMVSALLLHRAKIEYGFCTRRRYQCWSLNWTQPPRDVNILQVKEVVNVSQMRECVVK